jgi:hypothetical protein
VKRYRSFVVVCSLLILVGGLTAAIYFRRPIALVYELARIIPGEEKRVLYHIDHETLARELRAFAAEQRWNNPKMSTAVDFFYGDDPKLPAQLRQFRPGWIQISDDRIDFGCGQSVFDKRLSFGISVWRVGREGYGTKKLADGVWFYSEDGHVPSRFSLP